LANGAEHNQFIEKMNCDMCPKNFQIKDKLKDHMENIHKVFLSEDYVISAQNT